MPEGESRGIPVELKALARESGKLVMANTVAVGALLTLLGLETRAAERILQESFSGKEEIVT